MILVTFAVPQESREFLGRLSHSGALGPAEVGNLGVEEVGVLHTGMGAKAAGEAVRQAIGELQPASVIAAGFAGGLLAELEDGQVIAAENLSAPNLLQRLPPAVRRVRLTSVAHALDTPEDKARVRQETRADAVDLESAAIAEACAETQTPVLVLRIISDAANEPLPLPADVAYDAEQQHIRPLAILQHLGSDPKAIDPLARFAHRLPELQRALAEAIVAVINSRT